MANGHPKFGETNGVTLLDVGQLGGTRANAGTAVFTNRLVPGSEQAEFTENRAAQQTGIVRNLIGYAGGSVSWRGNLKVDSLTTLRAIISELNQKKHGHTRNSSGTLLQPDPAQVRETRLTDYDGTVIADRVVINEWRMGERKATPEGKIVVSLDIEFRIL